MGANELPDLYQLDGDAGLVFDMTLSFDDLAKKSVKVIDEARGALMMMAGPVRVAKHAANVLADAEGEPEELPPLDELPTDEDLLGIFVMLTHARAVIMACKKYLDTFGLKAQVRFTQENTDGEFSYVSATTAPQA